MGRSISSHLFTNVTRKAKAKLSKIFAFSAQVITVRGLMTVEMSPLMKPLRVSSASDTMAEILSRPSLEP